MPSFVFPILSLFFFLFIYFFSGNSIKHHYKKKQKALLDLIEKEITNYSDLASKIEFLGAMLEKIRPLRIVSWKRYRKWNKARLFFNISSLVGIVSTLLISDHYLPQYEFSIISRACTFLFSTGFVAFFILCEIFSNKDEMYIRVMAQIEDRRTLCRTQLENQMERERIAYIRRRMKSQEEETQTDGRGSLSFGSIYLEEN